MYKSFIGERVTVFVSSRGEHVLEYNGLLKSENENEIILEEAVCNILLNNFSKGFFGSSDANQLGNNMDKVIINKDYIISCGK